MSIGTMRACLLLVALLVCAACEGWSASTPSTSLPSAGRPSTTQSAAEATPFRLGSALVPTIAPIPAFAGLKISVEGEEPLGQPADALVWKTNAFALDRTYMTRVAAAFAVSGAGVTGAGPDGSPPWRLWLGDRTLAINERTGDVLFFDPHADDGLLSTGPAVHDYAPDLIKLLQSFGGSGNLELAQTQHLRGGEALLAGERVADGAWVGPGSRDGVALFAERFTDTSRFYGTIVYDTDELVLYTARGRPVELIHRPLGAIEAPTPYPRTLYRDAVRELKANPNRYLRLVSAMPNEPVTLRIDTALTREGHAWGGIWSSDLTRYSRTLVPVYAFRATGTTGSGQQISALFVVDAVAPEFRSPPVSGTRNQHADDLLRQQLTVSLAGRQTELTTPIGAARAMASSGCQTDPTRVQMIDAETANVSFACSNGATPSFEMKRAFPGVERSIWYASAVTK